MFDSRLKGLLRTLLVESGWTDKLRAESKKRIQEKGPNSATLDQLHEELNAFARETVPGNIQVELLEEIKKWLDSINL